MNRYPLVFARTRPLPELSVIRDSFESRVKITWSQTAQARDPPRTAVKLKRPATSPKTSKRSTSAAPAATEKRATTDSGRRPLLRSRHRLAVTTAPDNWGIALQPVEVDGLPWKVHAGLKEGTATLPHHVMGKRKFEHVFGPQVRNKEKRVALVQFLTLALGISAPTSRLLVTQRKESQEVSLVFTGPKSPLSPCCDSPVVFTFSKDLCGKVLCMASYCPIRTVANFYVPAQLRTQLWTESEDGELCLQLPPKPVSIRATPKSTSNGFSLFTNEKLRHVSPMNPSSVPLFFQVRSTTPGRPGMCTSPLMQVLDRGHTRHHALRQHETAAVLFDQFSSLLLTSPS